MLMTSGESIRPYMFVITHCFVNRNQVFHTSQYKRYMFSMQYFFKDRIIHFFEVEADIRFIVWLPTADTMVVRTTAGSTASCSEKLFIILFFKMYYVIHSVWHRRYVQKLNTERINPE